MGDVPHIRSDLTWRFPPCTARSVSGAAESVNGLDAGLAAVAATPQRQLEQELRRLSGEVRLPGWTRRLAAGDPGVLKKVCAGLKHFHRTKIAPQLASMSQALSKMSEDQAPTLPTASRTSKVDIDSLLK